MWFRSRSKWQVSRGNGSSRLLPVHDDDDDDDDDDGLFVSSFVLHSTFPPPSLFPESLSSPMTQSLKDTPWNKKGKLYYYMTLFVCFFKVPFVDGSE